MWKWTEYGSEIKDGFNGAADFHRRKSRLAHPQRYDRAPASMGPPIFIGGNVRCGGEIVEDDNASMGPPIFIGGNKPNIDYDALASDSFNGAADFHRRKFAEQMRGACR